MQLINPSTDSPSVVLRFGLAFVFVATTFYLKLMLLPEFEGRSPFLLCVIPIALSAWYGGLWPGLLASMLCAITIDAFFLNTRTPVNNLHLRIFLFLIQGAVISGLIEALHVTRRRLSLTAAENERLLRESEKANLAKDEFLAMVSHDLRTPITSALGWIRMMQAGSLDPTLEKHGVEAIERSMKIQVRLIDDILDATRIMSGKLTINMTTLRVDQAIQEAASTLSPSAAQKKINLTVEIPHSGNREIMADPDRIKQVLWNLLSNAIKFTPEGGSIRLSLTWKDDSAVITVHDNGAGISPEFLPHMFDRFIQEERTRKAHSGLGLGLAISKHIVELHGGQIHADSRGKNLGSTFEVILPIGKPDAEMAQPQTAELHDNMVKSAT